MLKKKWFEKSPFQQREGKMKVYPFFYFDTVGSEDEGNLFFIYEGSCKFQFDILSI